MSRRRGWVAALLVVLVAAAVLAADRVADEPEQVPTAAPVDGADEVPAAGGSVCAVGLGPRPERVLLDVDDLSEQATDDEDGDDDEDGEEADDEAADGEEVDGEDAVTRGSGEASSPADLIVARHDAVGSGPSEPELELLREGERSTQGLPEVFPGADERERLPTDEELTAAWLRWRDAPVATTREWRIEDDDLPPATVAGGCAATSAQPHVIPGMSTAGGDEAHLRLANPFRSAATVAVGFLTPEGAEEPVALRNLTVPPRSVREVIVDEVLPEREDLAAVVEVASGRLAVEGLQIARADAGDVDGASLLAASTAAAEQWTIPWLSDVDAAESWLWVTNREERTADVELTLHGPDGREAPSGLAEVEVPPGEQRRVDLTATFPDDLEVAGVSARSDGVPVTVSGGASIAADAVEDTASIVQLGAAPDATWVVSGARGAEREEALRLVNPGTRDAVLDVTVFTGVTAEQPEELSEVTVPAGAARTVALDGALEDASDWTAFVTATEGEVVVGRVGQDRLARDDEDAEDDADAADEQDADDEDAEDEQDADDEDAEDEQDADDADDEIAPRHLVVAPGVSSAAWVTRQEGMTGRQVEGLTRQLRTRTGEDGGAEPSDEDRLPGFDPPAEDP
jgi:hypothetical protein